MTGADINGLDLTGLDITGLDMTGLGMTGGRTNENHPPLDPKTNGRITRKIQTLDFLF